MWTVASVLVFAFVIVKSATADICVLDPFRITKVEGYVLVTRHKQYEMPPRAEVRVLDHGKVVANVSVGTDGHFEIKDIPPGRYELSIVSREYSAVGTKIIVLKKGTSQGDHQILVLLSWDVPGGCHGSSVAVKSRKQIAAILKSAKPRKPAELYPPLPSS